MEFAELHTAYLCKLMRILLRISLALACASVLLPTFAHAINIVEGTNKLQYATEIGKKYIHPLGLNGKTAADANRTLLGEGFRCDIEVINPNAMLKQPKLRCVKQPSGFGPLCDELLLTVRLEVLPGAITIEDLYKQLDATKVDFAMTLCPYPHAVSTEYLAMRGRAEEELQRQVNAQQFLGNAKATYERLMLSGAYCGFEVDRSSDNTVGTAAVICTKLPSGIKYCFESKLVMDVKWPQHMTSMEQLFDALPQAEVTAVHSSCVIPLIQTTAGALSS